MFTDLQRFPFLYLFLGLALFGLAIDLRLRVSRPAAVPQLPWAILLFVWCVLGMTLKAPHHIVAGGLEVAVAVTLFAVIAHSVQTFRALHVIAATLLGLALFLSAIGVHQNSQPLGCVLVPADAEDLSAGIPDGRPCDMPVSCLLGEGAEPGAEYMCERVGLLETTSVGGGRVRYRGVLQDPNELALAVAIAMAFAFGFYASRRSLPRALLVGASVALVTLCVMYTQSRGGQLVLAAVIGMYAVYRYRWKAVAAGTAVAIPVVLSMMRGGGDDARRDAAASTAERLEAWSTGIEIFRSNPLLGAGQGQFGEYHYLTAHNSYVLAAAELGAVGMILWMIILYLSLKIPFMALVRYRDQPAARQAVVWSRAMLASFAGLALGILLLSWTYHYVLWIWVGLTGGLYSAIRTHDSGFRVRFGVVDLILVVAACAGILGGLFVYLRVLGV